MRLKRRNCECCGNNKLKTAWSSKNIERTANDIYDFSTNIVVCDKCGFCFNSPCPTEETLNKFYKDLIPSKSFAYSIEKRIKILKRYSKKHLTFIEIGGGECKEFHARLKPYFKTIKNIWIDKAYLENSVDVLAHYDVLEHVPNVKDFFNFCYKILRKDGVMICEVPDMHLYPRNIHLFTPLHINHFSIHTLAMLAQANGFNLIEIGYSESSRSFSFLSIFRKGNISNDIEYLNSIACLNGGKEQLDRFYKHINYLKRKITSLGKNEKKITLWCATSLIYPLLENFRLPKTAIIIDKDPNKKMFKDIQVFQPKDCLNHIKNSDLLVIFSPRNKLDILKWLKEKNINLKNIEVVGSGEYGEPLCV